jgi:hypothetical protein
MTFLGIEIDTIAMEARLLSDKIKKILAAFESFRARRRITLREMQSLIGLFNLLLVSCCHGEHFYADLLISLVV